MPSKLPKRKRFTLYELAKWEGVHRNTMAKRLKQQNVDLYDPMSVMGFVRYGMRIE